MLPVGGTEDTHQFGVLTSEERYVAFFFWLIALSCIYFSFSSGAAVLLPNTLWIILQIKPLLFLILLIM